MDFVALEQQIRRIGFTYPDIPWGGCGKFALALGTRLEKAGERE